jgi:hypothetical protein
MIVIESLIERKSRMPQIQGVQGRMPYAAARQQPSTCERLATQEMGYHRLSCKVNKIEKKKSFITHCCGLFKTDIESC